MGVRRSLKYVGGACMRDGIEGRLKLYIYMYVYMGQEQI